MVLKVGFIGGGEGSVRQLVFTKTITINLFPERVGR